jgi:hypothetical protein
MAAGFPTVTTFSSANFLGFKGIFATRIDFDPAKY